LLGYTVSLFVFLIAFLLHWEIGKRGFPFVTFIPAVMLAALFGGRRPGILVAMLSGVTAWYFFIRPFHSFTGFGVLGLYFLTIVIILSIVEEMYRSIDKYRTEETLAATMFHELQHRVANNLQFISSFLAYQKRRIEKDPRLAEPLIDEAVRRLATMALIHRRLYEPRNAGVHFAAMLQEVIYDLIDSAGMHNVLCSVDMPELRWEQEKLVTLTLLIMELVTNALKHAFGPDGGAIRIDLRVSQNNGYELSVSDNGRGLPDHFDIGQSTGLGMQIIQSLVNQLSGNLTMTNANGTLARVTIPV
jgi:two-component sensor histidine kinase